MKPLIGTQMMYYLRMYDQRMNFVSQAVGNGALKIIEKTRKDGSIERVIESGGGASIANTVRILKQATPLVGNGEAVNRLFTMYMSAIRAEDKGFAALHFGEDLTQADLKAAKASIDKNPEVKKIFDAARAEYNEYNKDMMNFLAQTGAISKETAAELTKNNDYIPWYRERNGVAELVIGSEAPIKIGNIKEQPYLQELVGGDRPILDFMTSSVQNTNMLVDMGLRNLSTKNAVIELANMGLAKIGKTKMAGPDIVRFKVDGDDRYAIINTDDAGVPADVLVKGMEGIPTQMPGMFRLLGMPATFCVKPSQHRRCTRPSSCSVTLWQRLYWSVRTSCPLLGRYVRSVRRQPKKRLSVVVSQAVKSLPAPAKTSQKSCVTLQATRVVGCRRLENSKQSTWRPMPLPAALSTTVTSNKACQKWKLR